jgi:hypothetical protein
MADKQQLAAALSGSIQATPRNPVLGGVADLLGMAYKLPEMPRMGVPGMDFLAANRKKVLDLLGMGDIQKTADTLSYGGAIGTGSGMTYRPKDETIGAALTVAPMVAPAARMVGKGAVETGRFVAPKAGQLAEQYMVNTGGILPLDVYHGSPHTFPPTSKNPLGEFDASKIGTGEGAQAYGHGIYTAENPAVAQKYKEQLGTQMQYKGQQFYDPIVGRKTATTGNTEIDDYLLSYLGDTGVVRKELLNAAKEMRASKNPQALKEYQTLMAEFRKIRPDVTAANTGNLYKVDLPDEKIAKMLDWDKPLSQQPNILKVLEKNYRSDYLDMFKNRPGSDFYKAISGNEGVEDLRVLGSSELTKIGIPGIKYLDEMSRSAGEGTRNFVVFPGEEKSMTILERNAQKK